MTQLHNARYRAHADLGFYQTWRTATTPKPPTRYCACGTRIRQSKTSLEAVCDTCDDQRHRSAAAVELHPYNNGYTACPTCGGPKFRDAAQCRTCKTR